MRTFFKSLLNFVTALLLLFFFFDFQACGVLASQPRIESAPLVLGGKVLTSGLPGKFQGGCF